MFYTVRLENKLHIFYQHPKITHPTPCHHSPSFFLPFQLPPWKFLVKHKSVEWILVSGWSTDATIVQRMCELVGGWVGRVVRGDVFQAIKVL